VPIGVCLAVCEWDIIKHLLAGDFEVFDYYLLSHQWSLINSPTMQFAEFVVRSSRILVGHWRWYIKNVCLTRMSIPSHNLYGRTKFTFAKGAPQMRNKNVGTHKTICCLTKHEPIYYGWRPAGWAIAPPLVKLGGNKFERTFLRRTPHPHVLLPSYKIWPITYQKLPFPGIDHSGCSPS